jgi:hypothetical protein
VYSVNYSAPSGPVVIPFGSELGARDTTRME